MGLPFLLDKNQIICCAGGEQAKGLSTCPSVFRLVVLNAQYFLSMFNTIFEMMMSNDINSFFFSHGWLNDQSVFVANSLNPGPYDWGV